MTPLPLMPPAVMATGRGRRRPSSARRARIRARPRQTVRTMWPAIRAGRRLVDPFAVSDRRGLAFVPGGSGVDHRISRFPRDMGVTQARRRSAPNRPRRTACRRPGRRPAVTPGNLSRRLAAIASGAARRSALPPARVRSPCTIGPGRFSTGAVAGKSVPRTVFRPPPPMTQSIAPVPGDFLSGRASGSAAPARSGGGRNRCKAPRTRHQADQRVLRHLPGPAPRMPPPDRHGGTAPRASPPPLPRKG